MQSTSAKELLTAGELAQRLRVRPDTVQSWSRRGLIPRIQLSAKTIRYDLIAVVDALTARQRGSADE